MFRCQGVLEREARVALNIFAKRGAPCTGCYWKAKISENDGLTSGGIDRDYAQSGAARRGLRHVYHARRALHPLRALGHDRPSRLGTVCLFGGRTDFIEKYFETIADSRAALRSPPWTGAAKADRRGCFRTQRRGIHAENFAHHDGDVRTFMSENRASGLPAALLSPWRIPWARTWFCG